MLLRYFGTDGLRGRVGELPIEPEFLTKFGWVLGNFLQQQYNYRRISVIIGQDTRDSGDLLAAALITGLTASGVYVIQIGVAPTPAIAYLTSKLEAVMGLVISASHNPYYDNGVKLFGPDGYKIPKAWEVQLEQTLQEVLVHSNQLGLLAPLGKVTHAHNKLQFYIEYCLSKYKNLDLTGLKIVLDCAHGATYEVAPIIFEKLGAEVVLFGVEPTGFNINHECGSTFSSAFQAKVLAESADLGLAFDGDGDRVILVDRQGRLYDGDELLWILLNWYQNREQKLAGVVGTSMSNYGLELACRKIGLEFVRADVGDREVMEQLRARNWLLGAEPSGHILCLDYLSTGDGIISALLVLMAWQEQKSLTKQPELQLEQLLAGFTKLPQVLVNLRYKPSDIQQTATSDLVKHPDILKTVQQLEKKLGECGRILIRKSGTEPLIRIMVEGEDAEQIKHLAQDLLKELQVILEAA